jgi:predicted RNase H-like HicB family nuclease
MLIEYVEEALRRARYELIDDEEPYYGEVPELKGVWASGKTLEECRDNLKDVIEGWILVSLRKDLPVPSLGAREIKERSLLSAGANICSW